MTFFFQGITAVAVDPETLEEELVRVLVIIS